MHNYISQSTTNQQLPYPHAPPSAIDNKDSEQTQQGEGQAKQSNSQNKKPIKIVFKKPETKAPPVAKQKNTGQNKKMAMMSRREQMNRELQTKVNLEELKSKIIQPVQQTRLIEPKKEQKPHNISRMQPPQLQKRQIPTIEREDISLSDLRKIQQFGNNYAFEEIPQVNKGKVAKKGGKNERPQQQASMSAVSAVSLPVLDSSENRIFQRRAAAGPIDLGVMSLDEVVSYCHEKKLISDQFFMEYMASSDDSNITHFIDLFITNKYKEDWNFRRHKITIMDHRRLAEYLVRIFPQQFKICMPDSTSSNIKDFLENLYSLNQSKYKQLLESFDADSKVNQWKIMKAKLQRYDKIPVRILPALSFAQTYKKTSPNDFPIRPPTQILKKPYALKLEHQKSSKKRTLNSLYNESERQPVTNDNQSRVANLKNQLRKKKTN